MAEIEENDNLCSTYHSFNQQESIDNLVLYLAQLSWGHNMNKTDMDSVL